MLFNGRKSALLAMLVVVFLMHLAAPSSVFADEETLTPEPTATSEIQETPPAPTAEPTEPEIIEEDLDVSDDGTNVVVALEEDPSTAPKTRALPIWCPEGVEPVPGQNGCTAEFGSISLLMDYLAANNLSDGGTIWVSEFSPPDTSAESPEDDEPANGDGTGEAASTEDSGGVDIILLDQGGNSLPLDSTEGMDALLNGEPVWCPDGITPDHGGDSCTASAASLGLLVSMMENGSLEDGAIYIQEESTSEMPADTGADSDETGQAPNQEDEAIIETGEQSSLPAEEAETPQPSLNAVLRDPIWCPLLSAPNPDDNGCTPSHGNLEDLIAYLALPGNEPTQDGTIWIEETPIGNDTSTATIVIDGNVFTTWRGFTLNIQGGWGGADDDPSVTGTTTFLQAISVTNWLGDVSVNEIIVQNTASTGLHIFTTGDISLDNVSSTGNALDGAFLHNDVTGSTGTVTLSGTNTFSNNTDDGLVIRSNDEIYTSNITANNNGDVGAFLRNDAGNAPVTLTGSNIFNGNGTAAGAFNSGLRIESNGTIGVNDVTASNNGDLGAYLKNNTGTGLVMITGTNVFNNNGGNPGTTLNVDPGGLKIDANSDIFINNITADGNAHSGVDITTISGSVVLNGSNQFIANSLSGFRASISSGGEMAIQSVVSSGNGLDGMSLTIGSGAGTGLVNIFGTNLFELNSQDGLVISTYGDIVLSNSVLSANQTGASLGTACNITINSSTFINNANYGFDDSISAPSYPASITLNTVDFFTNGAGDYLVNNPNTVIPAFTTYPCTVISGGGSSLNDTISQPGGLPLTTFNLPNAGQADMVQLDCEQFSGTVLALANGDRVTYMCPTSGQVNLLRVEQDGENFPGPLPENLTFISALDTHLVEDDVEKSITTGELIISFIIPIDLIGFDVAILYWDGAAWLDLSAVTFTDGRLIFEPGFKTEDGRFEASTNFTGTFVLVRK